MKPAGESEFRFGEGKISGFLSLSLGALGFGAVLCLLFPDWLTTPEMRGRYPMPLIRALIQTVLVAAFGFGVLNLVLNRTPRSAGMAGMALAAAAALLGGAEVPVEGPVDGDRYVGLDWFLLNLLLLALFFVPLERIFALRRQRVFRPGFRTDLCHFFVSHLLVQLTVLLSMAPAAFFFRWALEGRFQTWVASQPWLLQFFAAMFFADLFAYGSHRLFHAVPALWRFHAIHHSSESLDWLAGSRLHLVDIVVTRAVAFVPLYAMGFAQEPLYAYLLFASIQAVWIHGNLRGDWGWLRHVLVTPRFHHWHHTAQREGLDRNFAVHLPWIDRIFGTHHLPGDRWPERYGIEGSPVPPGYLAQLAAPFVPGFGERLRSGFIGSGWGAPPRGE